MCIICVKPVGVAMPLLETINTMWQGNPDGAGLAYWRQGERAVSIEKGFMRSKALKAALKVLDFGLDDLVVLHFRWATHGLTDPGNCHPFPLTSKIDALRALNGQFPCAIAHNGIFGNMCAHDTLSDTQKFIGQILANKAIIDNIDNIAVRELISGYCGNSSKLAILRPGKLLLIGQFEKDASGLVYSNSGHKPISYIYTGQYKNDYPGNDAEYIELPSVSIDKCCELCQSKVGLEYVPEYELFLCGGCLAYNMAKIENLQE